MDKKLLLEKFLKLSRNQIAVCLLALSFIAFIVSVCLNFKNLELPYFGKTYDTVYVNVEMPFLFNSGIGVAFNDEFTGLNSIYSEKFSFHPKNYYSVNSELVKSIGIVYQTKNEPFIIDYINSVNVIMGKSFYSFNKNQIKLFNKKKMILGGNEVTILEIPSHVTKVKNSEYVNYKGNYNATVSILLSIFYNWNLYIIPWLLFFAGMFTFKSLKYKPIFLISAIFILGLLFRFNLYSEYPFWWDEMYTATITGSPKLPWLYVFKDPANPPLFAIFSKLWFLIFPYSLESARVLVVLFSSFSLLAFYALVKDRLDFKTGLLASFIMCFSIYQIAYAQTYRCFSLLVLLAIINVYFLFKYLEVNSNKNLILYTISAIMLLNTHLFATMFIFLNFIYAIFYQIKKNSGQKLKNIAKFLVSNFVVLLSFVPFFVLIFYKKAFLNKDYNSWISSTTIDIIRRVLVENYGSLVVCLSLVLLSLLFVIFAYHFKDKLILTIENKKKDFILYLIYINICFWILAIGLSYIRPLLIGYYFIIINPFIIALIASFVCLKWRYCLINKLLIMLTVVVVGLQGYNNFYKINRTYMHLDYVAKQQAELNPDYMIFSMIDPKILGTFFVNRYNVRWIGSYNSYGQNTPSMTKILENYANKKHKPAIFCVSYSELTDADKQSLIYSESSFNIDYIKIPYEDHAIIKITID